VLSALRFLGVALLFAPLGAQPAASQPAPPPPTPLEYEVKAAFLLNFAKLTEWPDAAFERPDSPIRVCVAGSNPFGRALAQTFQNETAGGRPLEARVIATPAQASGCHMVFVPRRHSRAARDLIRAATPAAVTVGESDDFLTQGGAINFFIERGRVRFDINQQSAEQRGVRFSSQLLRLARREGPGGSA
jgi:hypothetical protein